MKRMSTARLAGLFYVLVAITAPFSLLYVPGKLIVRGDAAGTASNILGFEALYRAGITMGLVSTILFILVVMLLYRLLRVVDEWLAATMVVLILVSVPLSLFDTAGQITVLTMLSGIDSLQGFDRSQQEALAMLVLSAERSSLVVAQVFWGLWLFPFGLLVMRSRFLPRILGALLILNGVAYVVVSLTWLLMPAHAGLVGRIVIPAEFGELWIALWLLIRGASEPPQESLPDRA